MSENSANPPSNTTPPDTTTVAPRTFKPENPLRVSFTPLPIDPVLGPVLPVASEDYKTIIRGFNFVLWLKQAVYDAHKLGIPLSDYLNVVKAGRLVWQRDSQGNHLHLEMSSIEEILFWLLYPEEVKG